MNFPVVIQQKRKWNTSSTWTLLYNRRLKVKRDGGGGRWITWGLSKRSGGEAWASELRQLSSLQRGENGRPLQATWGKEFWGSRPPFLGDTISLTANSLILWLLVSLPHFPAMIYRQLMNAEGRSKQSSRERAHQSVTQYEKGQPWTHPYRQHQTDWDGSV